MPDSLLTDSHFFRLTPSGLRAIKAFVVSEEAVRMQEPTRVHVDTISGDAAQLLSPQTLQPGSKHVLTLCTPCEEIAIALVVRWSVPLAAEGWSIGCAFNEHVPAGAMDGLAQSQYLERRRDDRVDVGVACRVTMEGRTGPIESVVRDYSSAGMCLVVPGNVAVGDKLRVQLPNQSGPLFMRVRWIRLDASEQLVGCRAIGDADLAGEIRLVVEVVSNAV